jgi:hypothetical protein
VIEKLLQQLASALTTLREETQPYLANASISAAKRGDLLASAPSIGTLAIDELCALLETQNLAAVDKFSELSGSLSDILQPMRFVRRSADGDARQSCGGLEPLELTTCAALRGRCHALRVSTQVH